MQPSEHKRMLHIVDSKHKCTEISANASVPCLLMSTKHSAKKASKLTFKTDPHCLFTTSDPVKCLYSHNINIPPLA